MASKLIVLAAVLVAGQAKPYWLIDNGVIPGTVFYREARSPDFAAPSFAYGFGSGFSSNVAGITHSSGIGASFQSGGAQAYGAGSAGSDGPGFAQGIGYANAAPAQPLYRTAYPYGYTAYNAPRDSYGNAVSAAQTHGGYGSAVAQSQNTPYGLGYRNSGYGSALASSAGYGSAATSSSDGAGTAISSAQSRDAFGYNSAVSASQNRGGVRANTAHSTQLAHGGALQQAGSTTIQGPGIQAAHSTVVNAAPGYY